MALAESLAEFGFVLEVWLINDVTKHSNLKHTSSCIVRSIDELPIERMSRLKQKYKANSDVFRWSLKSVILENALLDGAQSAVYLDNDQYFLQSPQEIIDAFQHHSILLTPHFYPSDPTIKGANWFEANFQVGVFNAGFIGVRKDALSFLDWWFTCCTYAVRKSYFRGLFDDQKYLDLVPALFPNVYIHSLPTWNFAAWNDWTSSLTCQHKQLLIGEQPVVFVHFATLTLERFAALSHPGNTIYNNYVAHLQQLNSKALSFKEPYFSRRKVFNYLRYLRWRILTTLQD